jgi:hypothetical protein
MNWFVQGGWPMYPILVCSVTALAAVIERSGDVNLRHTNTLYFTALTS